MDMNRMIHVVVALGFPLLSRVAQAALFPAQPGVSCIVERSKGDVPKRGCRETHHHHDEKGELSMNKKAKKLVLSRETLQSLSDRWLRGVAGNGTLSCGGVSWCLECPPPSDMPPC